MSTTPVKASFASAVESGSSPNSKNNNNNKQSSPVVKLPNVNASAANKPSNATTTTAAAAAAPNAANNPIKPLITIDSDSPASGPSVTLANSVKFGSFAAAAGATTTTGNAKVEPAPAPTPVSVVPVVSAPMAMPAQPVHYPPQQFVPNPAAAAATAAAAYHYQPRPHYYPPPAQFHPQAPQHFQPRPPQPQPHHSHQHYQPRPRPPYFDGAGAYQARPQFHPVPQVVPVPIPVSVSTAAAPIVKPAAAPIKLKLIDPTTGKEIQLGGASKTESKAEAKTEHKTEPKIEPQTEHKTEAKQVIEQPSTATAAQNKPVEQPAAPATTAPSTTTTAPPPPLVSLKKLGITIKDPNSNAELDIDQLLNRKPAAAAAATVDDLTCAMAGLSTDVDEKKELLAELHVEDDDISDSDEDEDEEDYSESDYDEDEEEDEEFLPSTVQYGKAITYPPQFIPYIPPADETGVWRYSRAFLLQFQPVCTQTPTDLHERLSAAVERAKAFARSTDRHGSGRRREGRRERGGDREPHRKRRHPGLVGPQAHLLDPNAVLKNRAENAWAPVKSVEELSALDRTLREVKGLLNKLTIEKFTVISDKILSLDIMSPDVLSGVIDCVFDKAVDEPRFAPMYAELCYKIVVFEMNSAKKAAGEPKDSQFRKLLVERCQTEYKHKRAWSKQRLEKLNGLSGEIKDSSNEVAKESAKDVNKEAEPTKIVGELTDEDYLMIKLKRRVLGNMRFIGEIFKVGLIGEKIMHSIITELLSNVENPEEEEIECLCRLLMTVGSILDRPEAANFWAQYIARLQWLIGQKDKLSSRIRFMIMDVVEARERGWRGITKDEGPKSIAQIEKESKERERDRERDHRPVRQFSTKRSNNNNSGADEWSRSGNGSNRPSRQASVRAPAERPNSPVPTAAAAPSPVAAPAVNRYESLLVEEVNSSSSKDVQMGNVNESATATTTTTTAVSEANDTAQVKRIVSLWDEFVQMNNINDLCEEFSKLGSAKGKANAVSGLVNKAVDAGKKAAVTQLLSLLAAARDKSLVSVGDLFGAMEASFGMIDDLAVDIPAVFELAGALMAGLGFEYDSVMKCLAECSDAQAKGRVCLYAAKEASSHDYKEKMLSDAEALISAHQSLISLQERLLKQ